jgi:cyclophilin family peptidyl-prolyl cis-trans isomerase
MGTDKRERQKAGRQARIEAARIAQQKAERRARVLRIGIIALVVVAAIATFAIVQRSRGEDVATGDATETTTATTAAPGGTPASVPPPPAGKEVKGDTPCPAADGSAERTTKFEKAPPMCIDVNKTYKASFETNRGPVHVNLDPKRMPNTVNNFVVLARYKYYDGSSLFRVDSSIDIIQGGSPGTNSASDPGPGYTIKDEGGDFTEAGGQLKGPFTYKEGQLVMARSQGRDSSGAQFFLTTGPKVSSLDTQGTYLLFGEVTLGLDVLKAIQEMGVEFPADSPMAGLGAGPREPVIVEKVLVTES